MNFNISVANPVNPAPMQIFGIEIMPTKRKLDR